MLLLLALLTACASPAALFDERASAAGLTRRVVQGGDFAHAVFEGPPREASLPVDGGADSIHVYIGGDGSPRTAARFFPPDPTPRSNVALDLMVMDPGRAFYLGRPCQHAVERCHAKYWTGSRYSEEVVASMAAAARRVLASDGSGDAGAQLTLIGFSGGGTLALLMAERLAGVRAVVTVAGNVDVAGWARHHGYAALEGSLDPASRPPLDPRIAQFHLLGEHDRVVPAELSRRAIARQPDAQVRSVPDVSHNKGWTEIWPSVLRQLGQRLADDPR